MMRNTRYKRRTLFGHTVPEGYESIHHSGQQAAGMVVRAESPHLESQAQEESKLEVGGLQMPKAHLQGCTCSSKTTPPKLMKQQQHLRTTYFNIRADAGCFPFKSTHTPWIF